MKKINLLKDRAWIEIDLDNLVNKNNNTVSNIEVRLISFQKEEAFLEALKRLQKELG